jgi:hypothetical protein
MRGDDDDNRAVRSRGRSFRLHEHLGTTPRSFGDLLLDLCWSLGDIPDFLDAVGHVLTVGEFWALLDEGSPAGPGRALQAHVKAALGLTGTPVEPVFNRLADAACRVSCRIIGESLTGGHGEPGGMIIPKSRSRLLGPGPDDRDRAWRRMQLARRELLRFLARVSDGRIDSPEAMAERSSMDELVWGGWMPCLGRKPERQPDVSGWIGRRLDGEEASEFLYLFESFQAQIHVFEAKPGWWCVSTVRRYYWIEDPRTLATRLRALRASLIVRYASHSPGHPWAIEDAERQVQESLVGVWRYGNGRPTLYASPCVAGLLALAPLGEMLPPPSPGWRSANQLRRTHAGGNREIERKLAAFRNHRIAEQIASGRDPAEAEAEVESILVGMRKPRTGPAALYASPEAVHILEVQGTLRPRP